MAELRARNARGAFEGSREFTLSRLLAEGKRAVELEGTKTEKKGEL